MLLLILDSIYYRIATSLGISTEHLRLWFTKRRELKSFSEENKREYLFTDCWKKHYIYAEFTTFPTINLVPP